MFCRESVRDLRQISAEDPTFPPILFVHLGTPEDGERFFSERFPEARAVADPQHTLHPAFGLEHASFSQLFGPLVWAAGARALSGGTGLGLPVGDPFMMPGVFLVRGDEIVWQHDFRHAGDQPDFASVPRA